MPLLMLQRSQNPNTTVKDMVELINVVRPATGGGDKSIVESIRLGIDLAQKNQPQGTSESIFKETAAFLKPLYETLSNKDKELYNQQFKWLQGQIQPLSQQIKDAAETATIMGFTKGGSSIELEKMRVDHEKWMAQETWKREDFRDEMKIKEKSDERRWSAIENIATKWAERAAPIIDAGISAAQKKISETGPQKQTKKPKQPTTPMVVPCPDCKTLIPVTGNVESITCPNKDCGTILQRNPMK